MQLLFFKPIVCVFTCFDINSYLSSNIRPFIRSLWVNKYFLIAIYFFLPSFIDLQNCTFVCCIIFKTTWCNFKLIVFIFFYLYGNYTPTNKVFGAFRNPLVCTSVCTILSRKSAKFLPDPYFYFGGAFFPTKIAYMYDFRACHNFVPRSFEQVQGHWNEKYKFVSVLYLSY